MMRAGTAENGGKFEIGSSSTKPRHRATAPHTAKTAVQLPTRVLQVQ